MYRAPFDHIKFLLHYGINLQEVLQLAPFKTFTPGLIEAVLMEAARFAEDKLAPLFREGDKKPALLKEGKVVTSPGFKEVYRDFIASGWNSIAFPDSYGGQGLPWVVAAAATEMWSGANMAFGLCPLLTQGAVELLLLHGSEAQNAAYLPKLVTGEWTGTMCLTEPQAGSDLGAVATQAVAEGGYYRIHGQKLFITYGDHDFTDNIIHMVLARIAGASKGNRGISLFLVPKFLPDGSRNETITVSLEHKLGIHASPTAVIQFGEKKGAVGFLVGKANHGLAAMFTMMNHARLAVGLEGIGMAERAFVMASAYAAERVQSPAIGEKTEKPVPIAQHPDVKRMLLTIDARTMAMRGLAMEVAAAMDIARYHADARVREKQAKRAALLIPVIKAHATDMGFESASLAMQVYGGMGYIEETGIAQVMRDSRIAMIYEGTNGIQALDLIRRKVLLDRGEAVTVYREEMQELLSQEIIIKGQEGLRHIGKEMTEALNILVQVTDKMQHHAAHSLVTAAFHATTYLRLFGVVAGGISLVQGYARFANTQGTQADKGDFYNRLRQNVHFYVDYLLPEIHTLATVIKKDRGLGAWQEQV